jgi:hypothetical protein
MKRNIALAVIVALLVASAPAADASLSQKPKFPDWWVGTWKDKEGGLIAIASQGGVLDLYGADRAAIYRGICLADLKDNSIATCVGDGYNHVEGMRFQYRNRLKLNDEKTVLTEEWDAQYSRGSIKGQAVFQPVAKPGLTR